MSIFGDILDGITNIWSASKADSDAGKQRDMQLAAAKKSIQWRVADAKAAGVHPLYALGNPGISIAPVQNDAPAYMSAMGQNLSRAVTAGLTGPERRREAALAAQRASVQFDQETQRRELENQVLRAELAKINESQVGPPAPTPNQGASIGDVIPRPSQPIVGSRGQPARQPGAITDLQHVRRADGGIGLVPSEEMKERMEDSFIEEGLWNWRNRLVPFLSGRAPPNGPTTRDYPLPRGQSWRWDSASQSFRPWWVNLNRWVE